LAEHLRSRYDGIEVELLKSSGGAYEIRRDGELVFSKHRVGRFPEDEEIFAALDE
jgi:selT/selW/selH-like putative selenoprotein